MVRTLVCLSLLVSPAIAAADPELAGLKDFINEALRKNPEILAARKKLEAARQRPAQARSLADPMLGVGYNSVGGPFPGQGLGSEPVANIGFMVSQDLPAPGKRRLRGAIAIKEASAVEQEYWMAQLTIATKVKTSWHMLHHSYAMLEILQRTSTLLERMLKVAELRYASGMGLQQDVLKAQSQLAFLQTRAERVRQELKSGQAELNMLAVRSLDAPVPRPPETEPKESLISLDRLYAQANEFAPVLQQRRRDVERAQLAVQLARKEGSPDYRVSGGYYNMGSMPPMFEGKVEFSLPFFTRAKQRAMVSEEANRLDESRRNYQATGNQLLFRIKDEYLLSDAAWRLMRMYSTTLIPQAALTLESSLAAYETGKVEFMTLLTNLMAVLEYESGYHEETLNYHLALIRLEESTGLQLLEE